MTLNLEPNMADPDGFYELLLGAHQGLSAQRSVAVNARLILLLANHVGDMDVLRQAVAKAREGAGPADGDDVIQARA